MRIAVLSDVHGNLPALEAVLEDAASRQVDAYVVLGDHVSGAVDPAGCAARLMGLDATIIRGNHDRWAVDNSLRGAGSSDRFSHGRLSPEQLAWLAGLPPTARLGEDVFLCHGTPDNDEKAWLDTFYSGRTSTLPSLEQVAREADGISAEVILCGHTHIARTLRLPDGRLIANPGSVGMQLVRGTPDAHYAVIEKVLHGWRTELIGVPYDTEAAARRAKENGFPGWAEAIRFGWAGPETLD